MPVAALIIGIASVVLGGIGQGLISSSLDVINMNFSMGGAIAGVILIVIGLIGGIVGIIISAKAKKNFPEKRGMSITGLVFSIIAVVENGILVICAGVTIAGVAAYLS